MLDPESHQQCLSLPRKTTGLPVRTEQENSERKRPVAGQGCGTQWLLYPRFTGKLKPGGVAKRQKRQGAKKEGEQM